MLAKIKGKIHNLLIKIVFKNKIQNYKNEQKRIIRVSNFLDSADLTKEIEIAIEKYLLTHIKSDLIVDNIELDLFMKSNRDSKLAWVRAKNIKALNEFYL